MHDGVLMELDTEIKLILLQVWHQANTFAFKLHGILYKGNICVLFLFFLFLLTKNHILRRISFFKKGNG